jgi:hypothetical protein
MGTGINGTGINGRWHHKLPEQLARGYFTLQASSESVYRSTQLGGFRGASGSNLFFLV